MTTPSGQAGSAPNLSGSAGSGVGAASGYADRGQVFTPAEIAYVAQTYWTSKVTRLASPTANKDWIIAVAVAMAESGGNLKAHNPKPPDDSYGLWQINLYGALRAVRMAAWGLTNEAQLYDPYKNAEVAHKLYDASGKSFKPWSTYTSGAYLKHMAEAERAVQNPTAPSGVGINTDGPNQTIVKSFLDPLFDMIGQGMLRVAGFIAGAILIIIALVMIGKGSLPSPTKMVKAVTK